MGTFERDGWETEYDDTRTNEDGETEYHTTDTGDWKTEEEINEDFDEYDYWENEWPRDAGLDCDE